MDQLLVQINKRLGIAIGLLTFVSFVLGTAFAYVHADSPPWMPASRFYVHEYIGAVEQVDRLRTRLSFNEKLLETTEMEDLDREKLEETIRQQQEEISILIRRYNLDQ